MDEDKTTTESTPVETGAEEALPVEQKQEAAEQTQPEVKEESTEEGAQEQAVPKADDKLASFAKGQGIEDISQLSEREQKLLKVAYDNNKGYQQRSQKASELEKKMGEMSDSSAEAVAEQTGQDPELLKRLQRIEIRDAKRDFFDRNPDAAKYESEMAKIAVESGLYGTPEAIMKASYAMAKANDSSVSSQVKQDTLKNLAQKQQSAVPQGNAVTSGNAPKEKPVSEMSIAEIEAKYGFAKR